MKCPKCGARARTNGVVTREGRVKERFICKNRHTFYNNKERRNILKKKEKRIRRAIRSEYVFRHWSEELQAIVP